LKKVPAGDFLPAGITREKRLRKKMKQQTDASLCRDCGADTTPCTGKRGCRHAGRWEQFMVTAEVWAAAGMPARVARAFNESDGDFLCVGCIERRLGRSLVPADFIDALINEPDPWDTPRLAARKAGGSST
jgi:hypothetical protein